MNVSGLEKYNEIDVKKIIFDHINGLLIDIDDNEFKMVDIELVGSRINRNNRTDSDLDAIVYYLGKMKEDSVFNLLNNEVRRLHIDKIIVDLNPKKIELLYKKLFF